MAQYEGQLSDYDDDAIRGIVDKLKSTHDGDNAVSEVVTLGKQAIPALRTLLFSREPSGLHQARGRAVEALGRLDAHRILIEFLSSPREASDPVERLGDDAVVNATARALAYRSDPGLFDLLLELARRPCLTGVIFAIGASRNIRALPRLVQALGEDASRLTAALALKRIGSVSRPALLQAAMRTTPADRQESESTVRQRWSALRLLVEMGVSNKMWQQLRHLMDDHDARIAIAACKLCLSCGSTSERRDAVHHLIRLSANVDWTLRDEIERHLIAHLYVVRDAMPTPGELEASEAESEAVRDFVELILRRIPAIH
jgi:hypothetical protein